LQEYLRPQSKNLDLPPAGQWKTNLQVGYPKPDFAGTTEEFNGFRQFDPYRDLSNQHGSRVWRLPLRFSFAANKPEKSRKPSAPAAQCERQCP
jgi:hypothetical protein